MRYQLDLFHELVIDNFAGGGGASTGIAQAIGRSVDIAINHDPAAIAMHKVNHPDTMHLCESVWDVDPYKVTRGQPVALCWLSPDCKHFSKAKGGKPVSKEIRGLAWIAVRWAATVRPRVIMLENVEEFKTWGPLKDGYPDPAQKGRTFNSFVNALKRLGYQVEFRELRASDYGAPTTRKRFFMIARCDGLPIRWPEATHADPKLNTGLTPWRTAAEIIDWSLPCPSIFETAEEIKAKYGLKVVRPLAENTMKRIARGIQKFVIENPEPFIVNSTAPFLAQYHSYSSDGARGQAMDRPLLTQDTSNRYGLVVPFLTKYFGGYYEGCGNSISQPVGTLTTKDRMGLVTSHLVKMKGTNIGQPVTEPLQTVTAGGNHFGEVRAFLTTYYGTSVGSKLDEPLPTVVSKDRFGLVVIGGLNYQITDIGMRMLEPRELFRAQGFPDDYIIDRDHTGKVYPKTAQVARCGNGVPPPFAKALVRATLPELCQAAA